MRPQRPKPAVTPASIKEALGRLDGSIQKLTQEVQELSRRLQPSKKPKGQNFLNADGYDSSKDWQQEPQNAIREVLRHMPDEPDLELQANAIKAIMEDLLGALVDVRATRNLMIAISNDSDLRAEFKNWQSGR